MMKLGGKEREFRFDWGAIRRLERATGVGYIKVFENLEAGQIGLVVDLAWAGLLHEEPDLELATVEDWLNDCDDIEALANEIRDTAAASFQKKK